MLRSIINGTFTSFHFASLERFHVATIESFATNSIGSCSLDTCGVGIDTPGFGGDGLARPMKPIPGSEMLVAAGMGKEEKIDDDDSPAREEIVIRRKDSDPLIGSNTKMS